MPAHALVLLWFMLSGFAGLIYQTIWLRELVTIYGSTVYASGAVLGAFMGGLAAGSALAARFLERAGRVTFRVYGALEVAIGGFGLLSHWMLPMNEWFMREWIGFVPMGVAAFAIKGLAALPFMLLPTMAMGATFPVFVRAYNPSLQGAGLRLAVAYSLNTLGATAGTLTAAFVLIPKLGLASSLWVAASVNLLVGLLALVVSVDRPELAEPEAPGRAARAYGGARAWPHLVYFLTGFAAIAAEVLWVRVLVLHLGNSVYAYAVMLALVLLGIALGSLLVARFADRAGPRTWFACLLALGLTMIAHLHALRGMFALTHALEEALAPSSYAGLIAIRTTSALLPLLVPTVLMGLIFPLGIRIMSDTARGLATRAGRLYAVNAAGGICGAVVTPTLLMGALGINASMLLLACAYIACALCVAAFLLAPPARRGRAFALAAAAAVLAWALVPSTSVLFDASVQKRRGAKLLGFIEGATSTVTVTEARGAWFTFRSLETNGVNVAGTTPALRTIQKLQGHLPLLLHPSPRSVLHVGFGSGATAHAVSRHAVDRIDIVEISPDVVRAAQEYFEDVNRGVWRDPRVRFIWGDGRNYLLATERRYDIILSDSVHPAYSGNGSLYTREYFEIAARRLEEDGIFSMWLPTYWLTHDNFRQILRAFTDVFPDTLVWYTHDTINRFVIVTGRKRAGAKLPAAAIARGFAAPEVARDLAEIHYAHPLDLLHNLVAGGAGLLAALADVAPHVDDRPRVEYESGRQVNPNHGWVRNFAWLLEHRSPLRNNLPAELPWSEDLVALYQQNAQLVTDGHLAYLRCQHARAGALFARAQERLPGHLEPLEYARSGVFGELRPRWCPKPQATR